MSTGFYWDERCFWHAGGNYAGTMPLGGLVQPLASGGLPEDPETKRRLVNLMRATGLWGELDTRSALPASWQAMARVHPETYLQEFQAASMQGGGELGPRAPFGAGGFDIASLSAGLSLAALEGVMTGQHRNAYALSRPPGHHCLPEFPNGFCLLANLAIAIEHVLAKGLAKRIAVVDWDVHHGNGTEAIFYNRAEVLTISIHQDRNYPLDTGDAADRGKGDGLGANMNIPLPPGTGHAGYLEAMETLVLPALHGFQPDVIIVACGFDAGANDPLGRMLAMAETFAAMTRQIIGAADVLCDGRVMMAHEGGYSEGYVPFCGHAVLAEMTGSLIDAPDPLAEAFAARQPDAAFDRFVSEHLRTLRAQLLEGSGA